MWLTLNQTTSSLTFIKKYRKKWKSFWATFPLIIKGPIFPRCLYKTYLYNITSFTKKKITNILFFSLVEELQGYSSWSVPRFFSDDKKEAWRNVEFVERMKLTSNAAETLFSSGTQFESEWELNVAMNEGKFV